jgi:hypothetical protein
VYDRPDQEIGFESLASLKVKGQKAKVKGEVLGGTSPAALRERERVALTVGVPVAIDVSSL